MGSNCDGFKNEIDISKYLNNKQFKDLNNNMQHFLSFAFNKQISNDEFIFSGKIPKVEGKNPKPDIWITIGNQRKNVSIKKGSSNSIHQELLDEFCEFLESINISNTTINNLKLYHYGDGTLDGSGETRLEAKDAMLKYHNEIISANTELNIKENLIKILNRILFTGVFSNPIITDIAYHGTVDYGVYASREEIIAYLIDNADISKMSGIKFSVLTYQPWTRDAKRKAAHPKRRYLMQIKWGSMTNCIKKIAGRRNNDNQ